MSHYDSGDDEAPQIEQAREVLRKKQIEAERAWDKSVWRQRAKFIRDATKNEAAALRRTIKEYG
jgi:hypothetical protein